MKDNFSQIILKEKEFDAFSAKFLYSTLKSLSRNKKKISIALSGGSTPLPILGLLKDFNLNWKYFNFFMVDERCVTISSSSSNYGNIKKVFLRYVKSNAHPIINDNDSIDQCVSNYEKLLYSEIPSRKNNIPIFDLILLGMGDDGHTASLFPNTKGLHENKKVVIKNSIPKLNTNRITLTYPIILNASKIIIFVKGKAKYKILKEIVMGRGDQYPIDRIIKSNIDTTCILGKN